LVIRYVFLSSVASPACTLSLTIYKSTKYTGGLRT
jgi:hypothetical protein